MSTKSLLTKEEIVMLRRKHIPKVHNEYRELVDCLNLVAEKLKACDGDEIYLDDATQIRMLKRMGKRVLNLEDAVDELKLYLRDIAIRLEII